MKLEMKQEVSAGPLQGVSVLDFTRVFSGPFATQLLGDLGADVIKVERLHTGEESRDYGVEDNEVKPGPPFLAHNRNKRSITIDLKKDQGQELAKKMASQVDVVVHNFRPGVMERLGLDFETLKADNPGLIYGSISGFGHTGSMSKRAANDLSIQAFSGILSFTGHPGGLPTRNPASVADLTAGMYIAVGVLAALYNRTKTGMGQEITTNMLGAQLSYMNHFMTDFWMVGREPEMWGTANRLGLPNEAFPTSDGWVCITSANDDMWRRSSKALGIPEEADNPKFSNLKARYANRSELVQIITAATKKMTTEECVRAFEIANVPCVPVNTIADIANNPILDEIDLVVEMKTHAGREMKLIDTPLKFSETPVTARLAPPEIGEHTDSILQEFGFTEQEVSELKTQGITG